MFDFVYNNEDLVFLSTTHNLLSRSDISFHLIQNKNCPSEIFFSLLDDFYSDLFFIEELLKNYHTPTEVLTFVYSLSLSNHMLVLLIKNPNTHESILFSLSESSVGSISSYALSKLSRRNPK